MKRLVILLSLFAIAPLLHPLYMWGAHDGRHSIYFLVEFDRSIQDGILWPRWAPDFAYGYGYPIFNIYAPLVYFLGEAFHLAGLDFVTSVKIVFALGFVLSGLAMFWFARDTLGSRGALVAAVVYMYVPYRLVDVYVRGALSESWSFVFIPLVLGAFRRLLSAAELRIASGSGPGSPRIVPWAILAAFSFAGLILTHTLALMMVPVIAGYVLWHLLRIARVVPALNQPVPPPSAVNRARAFTGWTIANIIAVIKGSRELISPAGWCLFAGVAALALSAVFWLPLVVEYSSVRVDQWTTADYDYRDHFVYLHQLVSPFWGYGISKPGPDDGMPFQLGVAPLALGLMGLVASRRRGVTAERSFFALLAAGAIFMMLAASVPIWQVSGIASLLQFPWRLLMMTTLALAFLAGLTVADDPSGGDRTADVRDRIGLGALLLVVVFASYPYLNPPMIEPAEGLVSLGALMRFEQSSGELVGLTKWNVEKPVDSPLKPLYEAGTPITSKVDPSTLPEGAAAVTTRHTTVLDEVKVSSPEPFQLGFYTQLYPGWQASVNGTRVTIDASKPYGLIVVPVPAGESTVLLEFVDTPPRTIGQIVSGVSAIGLLFLLLLTIRWPHPWRARRDEATTRHLAAPAAEGEPESPAEEAVAGRTAPDA